ncbi:unnamed protein product [Boreogadus saida]
MAYERCPTLFLALLLCLSPWPASGGSEAYHLTYNGYTCDDECQYHSSEEYYWCHTASSWGYCSPQQDVTYKGENCRSDHKCGYHGYKYSWCYTTNNNKYDYCGLVVPRMCQSKVAQLTYYLEQCTDDCRIGSRYYFWCHTASSWGYCSPIQDYTYTGTPCRSGHECGTYGYSYSWCYTTDSYDYCGKILPLPTCPASFERSDQREISRIEKSNYYDYYRQILSLPTCHISRFKLISYLKEICRIERSNYTVEPEKNIMSPKKKLFNEAMLLIGQWHGRTLGSQAKSNLLSSCNVRIDNQGMTTDGYINLQIQHNVPRRPGQSTTLAQILVPIDTSDEEIRAAFRVSLENRAKVKKQKEKKLHSINFNCPCL